MKSSDPMRARVVAEIDINNAVAAIEHFAHNAPNDRHSLFISERVYDAAIIIRHKAIAPVMLASARGLFISRDADKHFNGGCVSGIEKKGDYNSRPNARTTSLAALSDATGFASDDVKSEAMGDVLCRECFVWRGPEEPTKHGVRCSQRVTS